MSRLSSDLRELLRPVIEAARAALGDLGTDEVPASLRRVTAYSGGRLPPPLAGSLLEALDEDRWLREKAREKLPADGDQDVAVAFLERGDGWWRIVADALADARAQSAGTAAAKARAAADGLAEQLEVAKDRLRQAGADLDAAKARARRKRSRPATPARGAELKNTKARVTQLESEVAEARADTEEAEAMIARLRSRLHREARRRRRREHDESPGRSFGGSPLEVARTLDLMAAAAPHRFQPSAGAGEDAAGDRSGLELPLGVRPDAGEAVDWLATVEEPVTVIVDGYNVLYTVDPGSFTTRRSRDALADHLARLRRRAGTARVVVVYDSSLPGEREPHRLPGGVEIHFADEDHLADDEIAELVAATKGKVAVVTSDRDLRERAEALGALALWAEALAGWMTSGSG